MVSDRMPKVTEVTMPRGFYYSEVGTAIAEAISKERADYVIVYSQEWWDTCCSEWSFFDVLLNVELTKAGLKSRVNGVSTGDGRERAGWVFDNEVRKEFPRYQGYMQNRHGCLYRVLDA